MPQTINNEVYRQIIRGPRKIKDACEMKGACLKPAVITDKEKLGKLMRQLRQDSNKSLREVAREMDLSAMYISDCENGHRELNLLQLQHYINICLK